MAEVMGVILNIFVNILIGLTVLVIIFGIAISIVMYPAILIVAVTLTFAWAVGRTLTE
ncbi:hypothetical protein [Alkalihalobacillus pseudalcaliphilus]|uniref:hypothetical protein n=1 Tax=Alkalihalobacillus pseudalcaliphilus TaxID=79884 RepID=UPI000A78F43B|nr:hypothetical protein [Alkalihalobacillus pseudalcaliphilus]